MSVRNHDKKYLMHNYEKILKNCKESLDKYKLSQNPNAIRLSSSDLEEKHNENEQKMFKHYAYNPDNEIESSKHIFEEYNNWIDVVPPLWDECLNKSYVESLVDDFFTTKSSRSSESSEKSIILQKGVTGTQTDILKKDQAILVKDSDFSEEEVKAEWKPIKEMKTGLPLNTISISKPKSSPMQKSENKTKIVFRAVKPELPRYRIKSPDKSSSLSSIRNLSKKFPLKSSTESRKTMPYLRFIGQPRPPGFDFSAEHPRFLLDETTDITSFPCRLDKSSDNKCEIKDKLITTSEETSVGSEESSAMKNEKLSARATVTSIDKTWHEVLTERLIEGLDRKVLKFNWKHEDKAHKERERLATPSELERDDGQKNGRDVIYDSTGIVRWNEKLSPKKLTIQKLPVLCIRGNCKLQKVVEISIGGGEEEEELSVLGKDENIGYVQCCHNSLHKRARQPDSIDSKGLPKVSDEGLLTAATKTTEEGYEIKETTHPSKLSNLKGVNKYLAPFIEVVSSGTKLPSCDKRTTLVTVENSNDISASEADHFISNANESDISTQTDDEKLRKINSLKPSLSSSSTNPQTSEDFQSNQFADSHIPSSSGIVSMFLEDENLQIPLKHIEDVENILKEVLSLTESDEDGPSKVKQGVQKRSCTEKTDSIDFVRGQEISVQTDGDLGNYSEVLPIFEKELIKKNTDESEGIQYESDSKVDRQSKKIVDEIVEQICKDETEGLQNFRLRASMFFNPNDDTGIDRSLVIESANGINTPSNKRSVIDAINKTISFKDHDTNISNDNEGNKGGNYVDNIYVIKPDETEEQYHQFDEQSSPLCLESHSNLLGRNCYCFYHRRRDVSESSYGAILNPLKALYDSNLRVNNISLQSNYTESLAQKSQHTTSYKEFQRRILEQNPRFLRTITKIYDAAPNVTTKPSNRMDPEVQRAVKKFLESLMEPESSLHRKYSTMSRPKEYYTNIDNVSPVQAAVPSLNRQTSKGCTPTTLSSEPSSLKHYSFSGLWKSNDTSISDTESSELQKLLDAPLWNVRSINTTTLSPYRQGEEDNLKSLTGSSSLSIRSLPAESFRPSNPPTIKKSAESISEGEILSLGEYRDFES